MTDDDIRAVLAKMPDERACIDRLAAERWPRGFQCSCGGVRHRRIADRPRLFVCAECQRQQSVTAGTALHRVKVPVRLWLAAAECLSRFEGIAANAFARVAGLRYETAWRMFHRLRQALGPELPVQTTFSWDAALGMTSTRRDAYDDEPRHVRPATGVERVVFGRAGGEGAPEVVVLTRPDTSEGRFVLARASRSPRHDRPIPGFRLVAGAVRRFVRRVVATLEGVHGTVGRWWLKLYLWEHEFRYANRRRRNVRGRLLRRVLSAYPVSFAGIRQGAGPVPWNRHPEFLARSAQAPSPATST